MIRKLLIIGPLLVLAAAIGVTLSFRHFGEPQRPVDAAIGQPFPEIDLPGLDAENPGLATSDLRQGGVSVVNLFASWCLPCKAEAPQLEALAAQGVTLHGIAVADKPADLKAFLKEHGDPFRRIGLDDTMAAKARLGASGVPQTYVVDGSGRIRHVHVGDLRAENVADILKAVADAKR